MGKSFFEFVAGLINGKKGEKPSAPASEPVTVQPGEAEQQDNTITEVREVEPKGKPIGANSIDIQDKVIDAVLKNVKKNFKGQKFNFEEKNLTLWTEDSMVNLLLDNSKFKNELAKKLYDEQGVKFSSVRVRNYSTVQRPGALEILTGICMTIDEEVSEDTVMRARVEVVPGSGSTVEQYYILEPGKTYNIGVGRIASLDNGSVRRNDIAIDDNVESPQYDKNKYVSRNHAHISYSEKHGFMLYVDEGGLRRSGKRTSVARGEGDSVNIEDTLIPLPLKDGDVIVLSKAVRLLFTKQE